MECLNTMDGFLVDSIHGILVHVAKHNVFAMA